MFAVGCSHRPAAFTPPPGWSFERLSDFAFRIHIPDPRPEQYDAMLAFAAKLTLSVECRTFQLVPQTGEDSTTISESTDYSGGRGPYNLSIGEVHTHPVHK